MKTWLRANAYSSFVSLACLVLCCQVVFLARENRSLKQVAAASPEGTHGGNPMFQAGEPFSSFEYLTASGERLEFDPRSATGKTLLFVSADGCPICPQVVPRWEEIAPHFLAEATRVLAILLDRPAGEGETWIEGVPLASFADLSAIPLAKLKTVPITILIDEVGVIEWVQYGTLTSAQVAELLQHL